MYFLCLLQYIRAFLVLKECMRLQPDDAVVYLQAAKLCYEHLDMVRDLVLVWMSARLDMSEHFERSHCSVEHTQ